MKCPSDILLSKIKKTAYLAAFNIWLFTKRSHLLKVAYSMVGLGRLELPTSPLSGVRSNHLSYRPIDETGGAGRDRTGDLLNANQALSQLSYSPLFGSFPN
jgi:hypothetical protein